MSAANATELLGRAARLYRQAGSDGDACRCLEQAGDFAAAGMLHREAGRLAETALCFARAGLTLQAAQAHEAAGNYAAAAEDYARAGHGLDAAWITAHHLGAPARALALLAELPDGDAAAAGARALVRARCRAALRPREAAAELRRVIAALFRDAVPPPARERMVAWGLALAETLNRPDLTAAMFAAVPAARAGWVAWARGRLGTPDGIPAADLPDQPVSGAGGASR